MAITDSYASFDEYRSAKQQGEEPAVAPLLAAVSRYIDHKLDRRSGFGKDATATERIYMPKSKGVAQDGWAESENPWKYGGMIRVLDIEDLVSVTSITIDEGRDNTFSLTLSASDYELLPRNAATGPEPRPHNQIGLTEWGSRVGFTVGARVKVTGIHGWPAVPEGIKWACIEFVDILRGTSALATNRINEMDQVVDASPQARAILRDLMTNYNRGLFF